MSSKTTNDTAIRIENVSKRYIIGRQRSKHDGIRHLVESGLRAPFEWLRAYRQRRKETKEEFWALKNVSFEVKQGDVVGIIGRNGAGKSTLLKILSRITEPTTGRIELNGRVASLLEVGTGFHPELTGRENIYLNGAILGMGRFEIRRKFDEIVAFSEVEKFLDTPVKRYSSGMYVRLAFAVAAHLDPNVLVVDEVLAVGDSEFQKKCLGKMRDVSLKDGRTVLFVSHNMAAIRALTNRSIILKDGRLILDADTDSVLRSYHDSESVVGENHRVRKRGVHTFLHAVKLLNSSGASTQIYSSGEPFVIEVLLSTDGTKGMSLELFLTDTNQTKIALSSLAQFEQVTLPTSSGDYVCRLRLQPMFLASGNYGIDVSTSVVNVVWDHEVEQMLRFTVPFSNPTGNPWDFKQSHGYGTQAWLAQDAPEFVRVGALAKDLEGAAG